jgi:hypothetical protein
MLTVLMVMDDYEFVSVECCVCGVEDRCRDGCSDGGGGLDHLSRLRPGLAGGESDVPLSATLWSLSSWTFFELVGAD